MKSLVIILSVLTQTSILAQEFIPYSIQLSDVNRELVMIPVEGGNFMMGSLDSDPAHKADEGPQHPVSISAFWMGETEITWDQYEAFIYREGDDGFVSNDKLDHLGIDGVSSATMPYAEMSFGMGKEGYPAVNMTQYAALMYCKWLSAKTGEFYRLPTEAEWEYACKGSDNFRFSHGNNEDSLSQFAVLDSEKYGRVASLKPSELGLYDLNGNVAEWTMDQYDVNYYRKSKSEDPWLKPVKLYPRVARGGHFKQTAQDLRCVSRLASSGDWKRRDPQLPKSRWWHTNAPYVGFRVVRPLVKPSKKEIEQYWLDAMEDYGQ